MKPTLLCLIVLLLIACGKQKATHNDSEATDTTAVGEAMVTDTTKMLVADLPIQFDSTDQLIFPIRFIDLGEKGRLSKIASSTYSESYSAPGYYAQDYMAGNFANLVFQDANGTERKLTEQKIHIRSISFLRDIYKTTDRAYLLYAVSDRDTNGDKELTEADREAFYLSNLNGTNFKKLTNALHEVFDYKVLKEKSRLYFRTRVDSDNDGEIKDTDAFHYYVLDFTTDPYSLSEYNPFTVFGKK